MAFTSKSLSSAEKDTAKKREALRILHHLEKLHNYCSAREVATGNNLQEGCSHTITETLMHITKDPHIQNQNTIQAQTTAIHS